MSFQPRARFPRCLRIRRWRRSSFLSSWFMLLMILPIVIRPHASFAKRSAIARASAILRRKERAMDFKYREEEERFRHDFRSWLETNLPRVWRGDNELDADSKSEFERRRE